MPGIMKTSRKDRKKQRGDASFSKSVGAKWFCYALKLGFLRLICKGSLIFKLNPELPLSLILKEKQWYESNHVVVESRC